MSAPVLLPLLLALAASPPPRATAEGPVETFALVVASNRTAQLRRPPLQYADDDAAKYHALLSAIAGPGRTALLTELDEDTARLFPSLVAEARPPTRASLQAAAHELAAAVAAARGGGRPTRLYFVFAGHGDVEEGRGVLELADGPFDADALAALLREIGAAEAHVLLDSCNSFFVVNPRKPGGRRFATPRDAGDRLSRRLPGVGVFLSTSAEAEVFEWSELQSGVFSHAVRSGLLGGADVDLDGRITYDELAAFVDTASAAIKNPLYRPKVYARGPEGRGDRTFLDLRDVQARAVTLAAGGPLRLAVRDTDGLRWADLFAEAGQQVRLWLPPVLAGRVELERLRAGGGRPVVEGRYRLPADRPGQAADLAALPALPPTAAGRGPGEVFEDLFAAPFGGQALAAWRVRQASAPEPVYGVSREDAQRMSRLLQQLAASERERRQVRGTVSVVASIGVGAFAGAEAADAEGSPRPEQVALAAGLVLAGVGFGLHDWVTASPGERVERRFSSAMADPAADQARAVADADAGLRRILEGEEAARWVPLTLGATLLVTGAVWLFDPDRTAAQPSSDARTATRYAGALSLTAGASVLVGTFLADNPTEKIIAIWSQEPSVHRRTELSLIPTRGGALLALSGSF